MLERYFRLALAKKGFGEVDEVRWSLNSCQGDGMSFSGKYEATELKALIKDVYSHHKGKATDRVKKLFKLNEALEFLEQDDPSITLKFNDHRYVHFNTIYADWELGSDYDDEQAYDKACNMLEEIGSEVEEYAKNVAMELERSGYEIVFASLLEPETVWEFQTKHFKVTLIEMTGNDHDHAYLDDSLFEEVVQKLIDGKLRSLGLLAQIYELDEDELIGEDVLGGIYCAVDDTTYGGFRREVVSNAITHARDTLASRVKELKIAA